MKRAGIYTGILILFLCTVLFTTGSAEAESAGALWTGKEWDGSTEGSYPNRNCDIVSIGREAARTDSIPYADAKSAKTGAEEYRKELSSYYLLLSQTDWAFAWYENPEQAESGADSLFWHEGFDDTGWDRIFVPSVWQTEGYDHPIYTNTVQKFAKQFGNEGTGYPRDLPEAPTVYNPTGLYRRTFDVPDSWAGERVYLVFEGVDAAMYLWINGIQTGYAEDSFTTHEFDITDYLRPGEENTIAVKVLRWCDGSWIEDQDMYDLSGIFRDVYLYASPQVRVRDYAVITDFDKDYLNSTLRVEAQVQNKTGKDEAIRLALHLLDGEGQEILLNNVSQEAKIPAGEEQTVSFSVPVDAPRKWSAEDPYLYTLIIEEETATGTVYESCLTGFRKITYKTTESGWYEGSPTDHDLIRINGQPIRFNGVDRHETHPNLGYALTKEVMEEDVRILKENNINAVRTSHYPNNPYWYYLCDRYGIYLIDEANVECHSNMITSNELLTENLSAAIIDREYSMVRRDKNHASVVMWSLGNENKNPEILRTILVESYPDPEGTERILHEYTKDRPWHYEQARDMTETGIDVRSGMYALPGELAEHGEADGVLPMIECEYEHAMGNSEGNFDEYAEVFDKYRNLQGGFIWDLVDQSISLVNEEGEKYFGYGGDYGERIHDENFCANGLLLPDRTVQPEMAEVRYFYQSVRFRDFDETTGQMTLENYYLFTDIADKYDLCWTVTRDGETLAEGRLEADAFRTDCIDSISNQPGTRRVEVPYAIAEKDLQAGSDYYLNLCLLLKEDDGLLKAGHAVAAEQFRLNPDLPAAEAEELPEAPGMVWSEGRVTVAGAGFTAEFDGTAGRLVRYEADGQDLIVPGQGPEANFFRAATDNDTGFNYGFFLFSEPWKDKGEFIVNVFEAQENEKTVTVRVSGTYPNLEGLRLETEYTVYGDGIITVQVSITPKYEGELIYLPVAGMEMTLSSRLEEMTWFGRGPEENYIDRCHGTFAGRYSTTATDTFFPYVRSSETGNRTGVRWVAMTDDEGAGLLAVSTETMEISALHYTAEELNRRVHPWELAKTEDVIMRLNKVQTGVGGDTSWGRTVMHEQYLLTDENYSYGFVLRPLRAGEDPAEAARQVRVRTGN